MIFEFFCFPAECEEPQSYQCSDGRCIPYYYLCDGFADCTSMEDEVNCTSCWVNEFQCTNGICLWEGYVCNGMDDCGDMSDEENCPSKNNLISLFYLTSTSMLPLRFAQTPSQCHWRSILTHRDLVLPSTGQL